jgi:hypothetical protein
VLSGYARQEDDPELDRVDQHHASPPGAHIGQRRRWPEPLDGDHSGCNHSHDPEHGGITPIRPPPGARTAAGNELITPPTHILFHISTGAGSKGGWGGGSQSVSSALNPAGERGRMAPRAVLSTQLEAQ